MSDKAKRKGNPRRQLLLRLLIGIVMIAAGSALAIKQFEPEHLYLVYEDQDSYTLIRNLYLYDAITDEIIRQITDNTYSGVYVAFETASNAAFLVYQYQTLGNYGGSQIVLSNLKTTEEQIVADSENLSPVFSIHPDGNFVAYQINNPDDELLSTYLFDRNAGTEHLIHEYDYSGRTDELVRFTAFDWTNTRLLITYASNEQHITYEHHFDSGMTEHLIDTPIAYPYDVPTFSRDDVYMSYSTKNGVSIVRWDGSTTATRAYEDFLVSSQISSWHPDNHRLAVRVQNAEVSLGTWDFAILNADTGELITRLNGGRYGRYHPKWNYDGSLLLYQRENRVCGTDRCSITVIYNVDTEEEMLLPGYFPDVQWVRIR